MNIKLKNPLAIFDIEATGLDVSKDRIVEIAIVKINTDGSKEEFLKRVNPEIPIPAVTTEIHGISDVDIMNEPTFKEILPKLEEFISDCDLAGFNSNKFDLPMLAEELIRAGSSLDLSSKKHVDVQNIYHKLEQRNLSAAYQFYCKKELVNAHTALADAVATWEILDAQVEKYDELEETIDFLDEFSRYQGTNRLDFAGRLAINANGQPTYNFGKNKGKTIEEVYRNEPGYHGWFLNADFPLYSKQCLKKEIDRIKTKDRKTKNNEIQSDNIEAKLEALKNKFK